MRARKCGRATGQQSDRPATGEGPHAAATSARADVGYMVGNRPTKGQAPTEPTSVAQVTVANRFPVCQTTLSLNLPGSPGGGHSPVDPEHNDIGSGERWWLPMSLPNYGKYDMRPLFVCSAFAAHFVQSGFHNRMLCIIGLAGRPPVRAPRPIRRQCAGYPSFSHVRPRVTALLSGERDLPSRLKPSSLRWGNVGYLELSSDATDQGQKVALCDLVRRIRVLRGSLADDRSIADHGRSPLATVLLS